MTAINNKKNQLLRTDVNGNMDINLADDAGQNGMFPDIRILANSTPHVQQMARIAVTRTPGWMDRHKEADVLKRNFIYLIETHPESWTGFNIESTIGTGERLAGPDGQLIKAPTTRTVSPITPQSTNKAIGEGVDINYWNYYMDTAILSAGGQSPDYGELIDVPDSWTLAEFTWDGIVWEPNSTFTRARWAMAVGGLWPSTPIAINLERNMADNRKIREYTMSFEGGVYDASKSVVDSASELEVSMGMNRIKQSTKAAFFSGADDFDVDVEAGLLHQIRNWTN